MNLGQTLSLVMLSIRDYGWAWCCLTKKGQTSSRAFFNLKGIIIIIIIIDETQRFILKRNGKIKNE